MNISSDVSPMRPLIVGAAAGAVVGLVLGALLGLWYAWTINPAVYAGGAHPNEMSDYYQNAYVGSVAEAYLTNRNLEKVANRLQPFSVPERVKSLSKVAADFSNNNMIAEANVIAELTKQLQAQQGWTAEQVKSGLAAGGATSEFAQALGQTGVAAPETAPSPDTPQEPPSEGRGMGTVAKFIIGLVLLGLVGAIGFLLLTRIKINRKSSTSTMSTDLAAWDGAGPQPLRQWVGTYTLGQDNYDESFTIETAESDFLGECGMGILEGFASGSPKKVLAFDVWLFDKTDIRTVSMPIMSQFAYEDEVLRGKLPPDATPVLAAEGQAFEVQTTALVVKAKIEEIVYGDDPPPMSHFTTLKVSLTAFLKPGVDVSGIMPLPEGMR